MARTDRFERIQQAKEAHKSTLQNHKLYLEVVEEEHRKKFAEDNYTNQVKKAEAAQFAFN